MLLRSVRTTRNEGLVRLAVALVFAGTLSSACAHYHARPLSPAASLEDFEARRLDAPTFEEFLQSRQVAVRFPPASWDLQSLTLAAFYYSPALDVARAQWGVARGGVITAGGRPNPSLTAGIGYNATTPTSEITPWIPEALLDLPIEVAGKRGIRIAQARQLSEAARLNIITAAWQVRSRVRLAFLDLYVSRMLADSLLARQVSIQTDIVRILELQLSVGEVSPFEVTQARIALSNSRLALLDAAQTRVRAPERAGRRHWRAAGRTGQRADCRSAGSVRSPLRCRLHEIRRRALVSRSDILTALAEYEASQRALQLEIRKQYPDINLGPGYQLDQTDSKWTLSLSLPLPCSTATRAPSPKPRPAARNPPRASWHSSRGCWRGGERRRLVAIGGGTGRHVGLPASGLVAAGAHRPESSYTRRRDLPARAARRSSRNWSRPQWTGSMRSRVRSRR